MSIRQEQMACGEREGETRAGGKGHRVHDRFQDRNYGTPSQNENAEICCRHGLSTSIDLPATSSLRRQV